MNNQLEEVKMLLNIDDDSKDNIIKFYLNKVNEAIRDYTRIPEDEELPTILLSLATFKVEGIMKAKELNSNNQSQGQTSIAPPGTIKSISTGKTTITYQDTVGDTAIFNFGNKMSSDSLFSKEEKATMNRHRRMRFY
ncbi:head-tail connector protein [Peptacetobacter hiranonis]|uniref:Phage gp6-like head-tail connector protein n=1 Tax=Peptacetobacter hiranonis (strain DSM 13275 / JCM 10541 / KCTC 15199 / TO-931) TaxID=500633 RepID=B6FZZ8_PEPHT|nr:head-tail connector protein [Peptacetobacter hiranonis]EEA84826.1 hypothetical protein CLOHIR_01452 [Peptacetobacter hiranonis DSM 13275]QEK20767.1 hypothetical protein KGNDJEFE_01254 [Peptacetobacter hiranonis]